MWKKSDSDHHMLEPKNVNQIRKSFTGDSLDFSTLFSVVCDVWLVAVSVGAYNGSEVVALSTFSETSNEVIDMVLIWKDEVLNVSVVLISVAKEVFLPSQ